MDMLPLIILVTSMLLKQKWFLALAILAKGRVDPLILPDSGRLLSGTPVATLWRHLRPSHNLRTRRNGRFAGQAFYRLVEQLPVVYLEHMSILRKVLCYIKRKSIINENI